MKAVILAGGFGTRLSEETLLRPKPMVEIGDKPILWHIMKCYSHYGVNDFIICLGYKAYIIKEYFANYYLHNSDITFNMITNEIEVHKNNCEPWKVTLIDTGMNSMTGGRLKRVAHLLDGEESFCFTYGDGLADIDIAKLIDFHKRQGLLATVTTVRPPGRYGIVSLENERIASFKEKPEGDISWINGGFFVLSPKVIDYIANDRIVWENEPMERLAKDGQMAAYKHHGFWHAMDTLRDKNLLEDLWSQGKAPWRCWDVAC
ncbi:glucose-1-phosphate cytidylyltransferase [Solidesulfovibrio alcoholivorans]|uniref:glucose-1-phosphate cytidylyltransferase n=1 Tax=Solidesulfovibrio alcoholivorans TaxID=81406 RepID=UPI0006935F35|nr:glucose-1-phosphate cytidylyltransferase [Solidesulfovibrio alcoholivorans]